MPLIIFLRWRPMKFFVYLILPISLLSIGCSENKSVQSLQQRVGALETSLKNLDSKLAEQAKFIERAKEVIAEHRTHIQGIEDKIQGRKPKQMQKRK